LAIENPLAWPFRKRFSKRNVENYARLGIAEYLVFDLQRLRLRGYRLPDSASRVYQPLIPQGGRYTSGTLGLDIGIERNSLRFYAGMAALPSSEELIARLDAAIDNATAKAEQEAQRAEQETQRADDAERRLAEAIAEIKRLKAERDP